MFKWLTTKPYIQTNTGLVAFFRLASKSGDGYLYFALAFVIYFTDESKGPLLFYCALLAYSLQIPLYLVLKHLCKRKRPADALPMLTTFVTPADKFSLPSGHTAAAFLMATIVSYYYPYFTELNFLWATIIGLSRVILRVHYPFDVLIGASLGISIASLSVFILG